MNQLALDDSNYRIVKAEELPLDQNSAAVYLAMLRPTGRRSMHHYLDVIAELIQPGATALTLPWGQLRYQHTAAIRAKLQEDYKPATANTMLAALRRVMKEAWQLGQIDAEEYRRAVNLPTIKGETLLRGRALSAGELTALMNACACDVSAAGARDAALIAVTYGAGLRRSEVVKLDLTDYDQETGALTIRGAKGGKDRLTYLGEGGAGAAMADWLTVRGWEVGPLFNPVNKGGKVQSGQRMTDQAIFGIFRKRGTEAGVQNFSPHDMRRSMISDLLDAGADIATVQRLAGHAQVTTTAKYDRRGEMAKRKAAGLLHVPYTRKRLAV